MNYLKKKKKHQVNFVMNSDLKIRMELFDYMMYTYIHTYIHVNKFTEKLQNPIRLYKNNVSYKQINSIVKNVRTYLY